MCKQRRARIPLNDAARKAANDAFYSQHPELVKGGRRVPLSPTDASQERLRREWVDLYQSSGGAVDEEVATTDKPSDPKKYCPTLANLVVTVKYKKVGHPVPEATVTISGPTNCTGETNAKGEVAFMCIPPGKYTVSAKFNKKVPAVDEARKYIGSTAWSHSASRSPYPANTNKCNLFVYETMNGAGKAVPTWSRDRKLLGLTVQTQQLPPLAGHWADPGHVILGWTVVTHPKPGDVVAEAHQYSDASGHVAIISYPKDAQQESSVTVGKTNFSVLEMEGRTISASASEQKIVENDWGFRGETLVYRRAL